MTDVDSDSFLFVMFYGLQISRFSGSQISRFQEFVLVPGFSLFLRRFTVHQSLLVRHVNHWIKIESQPEISAATLQGW